MISNRIIFISFFLFFAVQNINAQEVDLGIKFGANFGTFGDFEQLDNQIGFIGGGFLEIKFDKFAIQPELFYSQQGETFDIGGFDFDYINLPIMLKFYLVGGLNFQLGSQFGVLINDNIPDDVIESIETDTFDVSGVAGFGLDLPLNLRVNARYIFDVENDFRSADFESGFFMLSLGIGIF